MREKVVPSRYGTNVSRWVSIFDVFDRARRPTDPPQNPHEEELGDRATCGDYESRRRKSEAKPRAQSPSLATACGVHGRIRKKDDDQWTKKVDRFLQPPVHDTVHSSAFRRETPSARTLVMPRRNPTLPVRTHGQTQRHARPSEETTGFKALDSIVSRRLRKSVGIRA